VRRHRLKSFACGMGHSVGSVATIVPCPRRPPHSISDARVGYRVPVCSSGAASICQRASDRRRPHNSLEGSPPGPRPRRCATGALGLGSLLLLGTLFATNGIVANDRKMGYYRFYFAKPVSAPRFYTNAFIANGAGLLLVSLILVAGFAVTIRPVFSVSFLPVVAAIYVGYGGVGFLLSTIWRFDWLSLVTVAVVSSVAWAMWGEEPGIKGWVVHLLPPMHRASQLYAYVAGVTPSFPWVTQLWLTGYGALCFAIGLVVLRTRSLS